VSAAILVASGEDLARDESEGVRRTKVRYTEAVLKYQNWCGRNSRHGNLQ